MTDKFPYTNVPGSLRNFLKGIPTRAVPDKVTQKYLASIGFKSSNERAIMGVLKTIKLLDTNGIPTDNYMRHGHNSN